MSTASGELGTAISNKLQRATYTDLYSGSVLNGISTYTTNALGLVVRVEGISVTTKEEINTWLSNNNIDVWYALATPTYTEITDTTLIAQLENILKMHTNKNVTNGWIEPTGTNAQGGMVLVYRKDLQTITDKIDSLEARISLLE